MSDETILQSIRNMLEKFLSQVSDLSKLKEDSAEHAFDIGVLKKNYENIHSKQNKHNDESICFRDTIKQNEKFIKDLNDMKIFDVLRDCKACALKNAWKIGALFILATVGGFIYQWATVNQTTFRVESIAYANAAKIQSVDVSIAKIQEQIVSMPDQVALKVVRAMENRSNTR